jgi:TolB protein
MTALNWRWIGQMAWLADSSRLVMVAKDRAASPNQVWLISSADGTARQLSNDANDYNRLSLAASGRVMAALQTKQVSNVWMIQDDGSERARQVTFGTGGYRGGISWAPDGNLVYESEAGGAPALSVMGADGGGARLLSNDGAQQNESVGNAVATPDGRYILYTSDRNGERHVWRMNTDGSNPVQLTNGSGEDYPHAAPDGGWVVYTNLERNNSEKPTLGKVSINGGELTKLTDEFTGYAAISPDGKTIACLYSEGPGTPFQIALYSSAGGPPQKIFPQPISAQFIRWKRDGSGITYAENGLAGGAKIWVQPLDGERPRQLIEFENDRIFGFDWSPNGEKLVVVRGSWTGNVVIFKNPFGD